MYLRLVHAYDLSSYVKVLQSCDLLTKPSGVLLFMPLRNPVTSFLQFCRHASALKLEVATNVTYYRNQLTIPRHPQE
jgi:hypothetical protein